ncbi:hypothetical protein SKAU_G00080880 [Synaphobranchus kaupii]|uniref:L-aminoadipate-semialdehyde dehydrogenase-phosphopantetheinyl transferase n=1 Tax=Synaphobranchus kaupii TaxID=118154 RepID=A0A9Q1FUT7_SYNKA|nr:hypothetical protein SKAU_G00080880 [Synaphobranchus kaupii]
MTAVYSSICAAGRHATTIMDSVRWAFRCGSWTPSPTEWLFAARCVQREEKERIGQFVFAKDAKLAMAGRLLIRKLISERMGLPWDQIRLERTAKGKPVLANPPSSSETLRWSFNVSHQGEFAVLAAEQGRLVGVDVTKTTMPGSSTVSEFFRIMTRQFTDHEWMSIKASGPVWTQLDMFHRHWALKESFIKAIGTGLGFNLQRVEFHISPVQMEQGALLDEHHHVAVAVGRASSSTGDGDRPAFPSDSPSTFTLLSFSDLVSGAAPLSEEDSSYWRAFGKSRKHRPARAPYPNESRIQPGKSGIVPYLGWPMTLNPVSHLTAHCKCGYFLCRLDEVHSYRVMCTLA